ncbi:MAG: cadherin domain-containing protein, partial [Planctomycetaceae bacterium]
MNTIYLLAAFLVAQVTSNDPGDAVPARTAVVAQIPVGVSPDTTVLRIPENSAAGTDIGFVSPSNTDRGGKQTYAIVSGNDGDVFSIDPQSGRLSVKNGAPLDFETHPRFQLGIETKTTANQEDDLRKSFAAQLKRSGADDATVAKMLEKVSKSVISIELTNVNEPPVLTHQTWTVRTDVPTGTIFGKLSATDPDAGDRLQFSIPEEITERFFTVEPDTGEVAVRDSAAIQSALDGLPIGGFVAEFQVTDAAGSTSVAKFPLTFEAPAAPTSPIEQMIPETAATETSPQEATQSSTEEAVPVQPGVSTVEPAEVLTVQNEPPVEASSGVSFWTILNMLTFLVLLGAGFYLYRWSRSLSGSAGREFSEERRLAETARTFDASSVEQERSQLAELKASLDVRAHNLATANDELEGRTRELDAHQQELAEMAATLDARADQLARQSDELEAQRAELLESSERIEVQKGRIETEARRLAELEAELKRQQLELTDRVLQLPSAQSMEEHQSLATIEATEKLVSIAAGNVEEAAEPESEEVLALRHQLADMFGVTDSTLARHRTVRDHEFDG